MNGVDPGLLFGFLLYMAVLAAVAAITARYMRSLDDYVLGGRRLGPWVAAISERASGESAWFLLGLPGAAYAAGFREFWSVIGIGFGIFLSWSLLAGALRRQTGIAGALTIPDFLAARFPRGGNALRGLATAIILVFYTSYLGAQFVGAGKIFHATFGIDPATGMLLGAGIVLAYTMVGGFLAVAWTDLFQGLLMVAVAVLLPVLGWMRLGGAEGLTGALAARGSDFFAMDGGETGRALAFGVAIGGLSWGFGYFGQPHLLTRYMAIRRARDVRRGMAIAVGWVLAAYWGAAFIGIVGAAVLGPDLADPEQVMPLLARELVPAWLAGILISGALAAMMSTADSQLLVAGSSLVEDVYVKMGRAGRPPLSPARQVLASRAATLVIGAAAFWIASVNTGLIDELVAYAWSGLGSSFGPVLLLVLRWRRMTWGGAMAGMVTGMTSTIVWQNVPVLQAALDLKAATFLLALAAAVLASLAGWGDRARSQPPAR